MPWLQIGGLEKCTWLDALFGLMQLIKTHVWRSVSCWMLGMVKDFDDIELNVIGKGVLIDLMDNQILSCSYPLNI